LSPLYCAHWVWADEKFLDFVRVAEPGNVLVGQGERVLSKLSQTTDLLPSSFVLQGVQRLSDYRIDGGGFADIYLGQVEQQKVALKTLRVNLPPKRRNKIYKVKLPFKKVSFDDS
jgi:hypothetical protein